MVLDKAEVLEWYDDWVVRSVSWQTRVPAVIILKEYMRKKNYVRYTKENVFLRDGFNCVYCGVQLDKKSATIDHVIPASLGGATNFENTVTSCHKCNSVKGDDIRIFPEYYPVKPTFSYLIEQRKKLKFDLHHPSWATYLGVNQ